MDTNIRSSIYRNGSHYDALNGFDYDISFYIDYARDFGGPVLDLGCGTGRITIPIAAAGFKTTGIDSSKTMLATAEIKAKQAGIPISLVEGDFSEFYLDMKFKLILMAFDSLCHLHDFKSISSCLGSVKQHLCEGGLFILDVNNPKLKSLITEPSQVVFSKYYKNPFRDNDIKLNQTNNYDNAKQINYHTWCFEIEGEKVEQDLYKRVFFPQELDNYIKFSGLRIIDKFGWFDKSIFSANSRRQIIISCI